MASREIGIDIEEISKLSAEIGIKEVDSPVQPPNRVSNSVILQGSPRTAIKISSSFPTEVVPPPPIPGSPSSPEYFRLWTKLPLHEDARRIHHWRPRNCLEVCHGNPSTPTKCPYMLGYWSAGGVIACESAQQLIRAAERVVRLVLIDAPCPLITEPSPHPSIDGSIRSASSAMATALRSHHGSSRASRAR